MAKAKGFGDRVRERLRALGYWKNGKPDIIRFSVERGYPASYVYRWAAGQVPRGPALFRLAKDLEIAPDWLLGIALEPVKHPIPIAGGSGPSDGLPLAKLAEILPLIGRWLRALVARPLLPTHACA